MKFNKFYIFAAGVALAMTSCGEGQYWDEASNPAEVYAFPKPTETLSVPADGVAPSTYEITVMRNTSGAAVTVPVIFSEVNSSGQEVSVGLLSGADEVTFPAGSNKAVYTINIADGLSAGTTYYAKISLEDPEVADNQTQVDVNPNNKTFTFSISQAINWTAAGTAEAVSDWVGNTDPISIPVQYASNVVLSGGMKLYRLVSPYWVMEPDYAEEGYNLQFYVDADNNAASFPSWQSMGEFQQGYEFFIGCPASMGCSFTNDGDVYTLNGYIAYGEGAPQAYYSPEVLVFQWSAN